MYTELGTAAYLLLTDVYSPLQMQQVITQQIIDRAMIFDEYIALTKTILQSDSPQGKYSNEKTFRYTRSNLERMEMLLQHTTLQQKLYNLVSELKEKWIWLVLTEPWCGDASWSVPAFHIISMASDKIDLRILLRDANPEIMRSYQTGGSNSIPKLICLRTNDLHELGVWGPRPKELQEMVTKLKNEPAMDYKESVRQLHEWYENDMTKAIQDEMTGLVKKWKENVIM